MKKLILLILTFALMMGVTTFAEARDLDDPSILVGYWKLNSNADDYSGNGNDGTWSGNETYVTTPWGATCGDFDGAGDYVSTLSVTPETGTVAFWMRLNAASAWEAFFLIAESSDEKINIEESGTAGQIVLNINSGGGGSEAYISHTVGLGNWVHLVFTFEDDRYYLYADGLLVGLDTSGDLPDITETMKFGGSATVQGNVDIAEARYYDVILTADEINRLYHKTYPKFSVAKQPLDLVPDVTDTSLVGAWLNKRVRGSADDLSSNNNDGTATGVDWERIGGDFGGDLSTILATAVDVGTNGTVAAWFNVDNVTGTKSIVSTSSASNNRIFLGLSEAKLMGVHYNGSAYTGEIGTIVANQWYYVVMTIASGVKNLYINGIDSTVAYDSGAVTSDTVALAIGSRTSPAYIFDGTIKDVRVYNEAKSPSWIAEQYAKAVPEDDLVLHVVDGEDVSRYRHTVTNGGATLGNGMEFDGATDYLVIADSASLDCSSITIAVWVKTDTSANTGYIIGKLEDLANQEAYRLSIRSGGSDNAIDFSVSGGSGEVTTPRLIDGVWTYVVATYSDGVYAIYFNGSAVATSGAGDSTGDISATTGRLSISSRYDSSESTHKLFHDGELQDIRIYNTAKSADWVLNDYETTKKYF